MPVAIQKKTKTDFDDDFDNLDVEYYPDEFIRELNREGDAAEEQYKRGELISFDEFKKQIG